MAGKSDQVVWLEGVLKRPLHPCTSESVLGRKNRKCYLLDDDGNITGLNLSSCKITDGAFLEELSDLTSLDLSHSRITDGLFLKDLTGLTSLDLSGNEITDWSFLSCLSELTSLVISSNGITDGSFLKDLSGLTSLNLGYNEIADWSFLSCLSGLTSLVISSNEITDGSFLRNLSGLTSLALRSNGITDWSFLSCLSGLTLLSLRGNMIIDGSFLKDFSGLRSLDLSGNEITDWSFLKDLSGLRSLNLSGNRITDGSFLKDLSGLTSLDLSANGITDWSFLSCLSSLTSLVISSNGITDGSFLSGLSSLTSLDLSGNGIADGFFLKDLSGLTSLNLRANEITNGSFLSGLLGLTLLDLSHNQITDVGCLAGLTRLRTIGLHSNQISELPRELIQLGIEIEEGLSFSLYPQSISVGENPLKTPPLEIVERGHGAIVSWFEALEAPDEASRRLNEVKVILVGDGGAGKTSLRKRLMGQDADPMESQTDGIEIFDWQVKVGGQEMVVHFWDFGGQVINHAAHQFFLSRRSLYLLVLDGRKEEDAEYWLKHIESFGGDSPVLVVLNKIDEHPGFDVNRPFLTEKYGAIKGFFRMACLKKQGSGIEDLNRGLVNQLGQVKLASTMWPGMWFNVKQRLEKENAHYIEYDEFTHICREEGVTDEKGQRTLVQYLNDLGVAQYFEDPRLDTTQVLEPRWVTQAVYRIINAEQLADGQGLLQMGQLKKILRKTEDHHYDYPANKYTYIVDLMKKFELCYELAGGRILVPDLLEVKEPKFDFSDRCVLRFRFEYSFLPRSVMPRFIVNEHADIHNDLRWRSGVVLRDPETGAVAVVKADVRDRKIMIEVSGERRREYFASLRRTFRRIHDSFHKLEIDQLVPLPDQIDHAVLYDDLIGHEEMGEENIVVGSLRGRYRVKELLDGLETESDRQERRLKSALGDPRYLHVSEGIMQPRIEINIGDNVTFHGDFAVGEKIKGSFNKAGSASSSDEIKTVLQQLAQEVAKIAEKLSDEKAEEIAEDLERLTTEATKDKPRRRWWELSVDGIREAAQSVGDVGSTAISLLKKLLPLLG